MAKISKFDFDLHVYEKIRMDLGVNYTKKDMENKQNGYRIRIYNNDIANLEIGSLVEHEDLIQISS